MKERRRRNDCPTRRLYTSLLARPRLLPLSQIAPSLFLTLCDIAAHAPGVSFLSTLRALHSPCLSLLRSLSLSLSSFLSLQPSVARARACDLFRSFPARLPLVTFALVRSPHRRVRRMRVSCLRSLARSTIVVRTSAHLDRWRESGQEKRTGRKHTETSGNTGSLRSLSLSRSLGIDPTCAGSNYGELTYLSQMDGSGFLDRANPLLRETSGIVSRIRARCCSVRPRSRSSQFPFSLYASDGARLHKGERDRG